MQVAVSFPGCHRRGGVERVMLESVNYLAERGHEVHAYASEWENQLVSPAVRRHMVNPRIPISSLKHPSFVRASMLAIKASAQNFDVVAGFGALAVPDSVVWMTSVHAAWLEISGSMRNPVSRLKQWLNPFHSVIIMMERRLLKGRRYRHLLTLSEDEKQHVVRLYDVPPEHITVVPNGFSEQEFNCHRRSSARSAMRQSLRLKEADVVFIFVGNEAERKGFKPLCRALAAVAPRAILLAVGSLDSSALLPELQQIGFASQVRFVGSADNVSDYYAAADYFVLPTYYEAWGLVIVEAMATGLPVLTSRLAGASVAIQEGSSGLLLDNPTDLEELKSKIGLLLSTPLIPPELISLSVEKFRWPEVLSTYENVLSKHANTRKA